MTNGTDRIVGTVGNGTWTADLAGDRGVFDGRSSVAPQAGRYTILIPGQPESATEPGGDGYATLSVDRAGKLLLSGLLADGTKLTQSSVVSKNGQAPLYQGLYQGQGFLMGWLTFTNLPNDDFDRGGVLEQAVRGWAPLCERIRPDGHDARVALHAPAAGVRVLEMTSGQLALMGGGLTAGFTNLLSLTASNRVINVSSNKLSLALALTTGSFSGSVINPGTAKPITFGGVLLQKQNLGAGAFLNTNQCGRVYFGP